MSQENQQLKRCKYYLFGHCNRKKLCPFSHQMETCQEGRRCKNSVCVKRHPKDCKFYTKCKFSGCNHLHPGKISHKKNTETILFSQDINGETNADMTSINLELERKLDIVQTSHLNLELSVNNFEKVVKEMEEKAKEQETKLQNKTEEINSLKEKIRYMEDKFKKKDEEITKLEDMCKSKNERYETAKEFQEKLEIAQKTNLRLEKDIEATKENVQEKEENINCLEGENHKMSLRVDELETDVKTALMDLTCKTEQVIELEKLTVTQQETIETVKEEGDAEFMKLQNGFLDLIIKHAPDLLRRHIEFKRKVLLICRKNS